jgi:hypothetical protein
MTACKPLADVGKRNKNAYLDVVNAVERLIRELDLKHSKPADRAVDEGGVDPATGALVFNPSQPRNGRGRKQVKRRRGAGGALGSEIVVVSERGDKQKNYLQNAPRVTVCFICTAVSRLTRMRSSLPK